MTRPPEHLETTRLLLRAIRKEDGPIIFAEYSQDDDVSRYMVWRTARELSDTQAFVDAAVQCWKTGDEFCYAITFKSNGKLIGCCSVRLDPSRHFEAGVGYNLGKPYWGQGYATEAVTAMVDWALSQADIFRVSAVVDVDNPASCKVLEKCGFQLEGTMKRGAIHPNISEKPRDIFVYAKVK